MAFNPNLTRYELVERMAAHPSSNAGSMGYLGEFDVVNVLNGDVIVTKSVTPRLDAFAALNAVISTTPGIANAIVSYQNSSGSVSTERTLTTAS
jgi:hypothetical protein